MVTIRLASVQQFLKDFETHPFSIGIGVHKGRAIYDPAFRYK
jgi:hypothetical protein